MASRPSYRPGMPKLSRYGISKAPSSLNISAAFFGSRNDAAVSSSSSSFAFFMCDPFRLTSDHVERDVHVSACGMRVGADLLMGLLDERGELGLREALVLDAHLHRETVSAAVAPTAELYTLSQHHV